MHVKDKLVASLHTMDFCLNLGGIGMDNHLVDEGFIPPSTGYVTFEGMELGTGSKAG